MTYQHHTAFPSPKGVLEMSHQVHAGIFDSTFFFSSPPHFKVSFKLLTSPRVSGRGAANISHPGGEDRRPTGPLGSVSHLGSGGAPQMAAMLMNPTGCGDTAASGRSK